MSKTEKKGSEIQNVYSLSDGGLKGTSNQMSSYQHKLSKTLVHNFREVRSVVWCKNGNKTVELVFYLSYLRNKK